MKFFIFILLTSSIISYGQHSIVGNIKDIDSNEPIPYALIYIDGTTTGVMANENGRFELTNISLPIQIEISHLSYDHKSIQVEENYQPLIIALEQRSNILDEVVVMNKNLREKYVQEFKKWFLGDDKWGKKADLINEDALFFFDESKKIKVGASKPLIIESTKLGYTIHVDLKEFEVILDSKQKGKSGMYIASYHFQENNKDKYIKNRLKAYYNSSEHFLKALYDGKLSENGFVLKKETSNSNGQKEFTTITIASALLEAKNSNKIIVGLKNKFYYILYYSKQNGSPLNLIRSPQKPPYKISAIKFTEDKIVLRSNGTTPGSAIVFSGIISEKKVGAMLPNNYQPSVIATTPPK